jgi:transcriptional regulator with XRE-family HTH domain
VFNCDEDLGRKLRECRLRAGLTQQKLATAMGRQGKGSHHVAGRLERGEVENPTIGLLADYLRGCRASFVDILDVLERYTARPTVIEVETRQAIVADREFLPAKLARAVERYDRRSALRAEADGRALPARAERVRRARNFGLSQVWAKRVRWKVITVVEAQRSHPGQVNEAHLQNYGGKVWRILNLTRKRRQNHRQAMLDEALAPYLAEDGPDPKHLVAVRKVVSDFFRQAELAGQLDGEPRLAAGEDRPSRGFQPKPDTLRERAAWDKEREKLVEKLWTEILAGRELADIPRQRVALWRSFVRQLASIVDHHTPESDECRREIEAMAMDEYFVRLGRDPALARRLAEVVVPRWEELRSTLGPHPLGRIRPPR